MNKEMIEAIKTRVTLGRNYKCLEDVIFDMSSAYDFNELAAESKSLLHSGSIYRDDNGILKVNGDK